jgi:hypothetical protein
VKSRLNVISLIPLQRLKIGAHKARAEDTVANSKRTEADMMSKPIFLFGTSFHVEFKKVYHLQSKLFFAREFEPNRDHRPRLSFAERVRGTMISYRTNHQNTQKGVLLLSQNHQLCNQLSSLPAKYLTFLTRILSTLPCLPP